MRTTMREGKPEPEAHHAYDRPPGLSYGEASNVSSRYQIDNAPVEFHQNSLQTSAARAAYDHEPVLPMPVRHQNSSQGRFVRFNRSQRNAANATGSPQRAHGNTSQQGVLSEGMVIPALYDTVKENSKNYVDAATSTPLDLREHLRRVNNAASPGEGQIWNQIASNTQDMYHAYADRKAEEALSKPSGYKQPSPLAEAAAELPIWREEARAPEYKLFPSSYGSTGSGYSAASPPKFTEFHKPLVTKSYQPMYASEAQQQTSPLHNYHHKQYSTTPSSSEKTWSAGTTIHDRFGAHEHQSSLSTTAPSSSEKTWSSGSTARVRFDIQEQISPLSTNKPEPSAAASPIDKTDTFGHKVKTRLTVFNDWFAARSAKKKGQRQEDFKRKISGPVHAKAFLYVPTIDLPVTPTNPVAKEEEGYASSSVPDVPPRMRSNTMPGGMSSPSVEQPNSPPGLKTKHENRSMSSPAAQNPYYPPDFQTTHENHGKRSNKPVPEPVYSPLGFQMRHDGHSVSPPSTEQPYSPLSFETKHENRSTRILDFMTAASSPSEASLGSPVSKVTTGSSAGTQPHTPKTLDVKKKKSRTFEDVGEKLRNLGSKTSSKSPADSQPPVPKIPDLKKKSSRAFEDVGGKIRSLSSKVSTKSLGETTPRSSKSNLKKQKSSTFDDVSGKLRSFNAQMRRLGSRTGSDESFECIGLGENEDGTPKMPELPPQYRTPKAKEVEAHQEVDAYGRIGFENLPGPNKRSTKRPSYEASSSEASSSKAPSSKAPAPPEPEKETASDVRIAQAVPLVSPYKSRRSDYVTLVGQQRTPGAKLSKVDSTASSASAVHPQQKATATFAEAGRSMPLSPPPPPPPPSPGVEQYVPARQGWDRSKIPTTHVVEPTVRLGFNNPYYQMVEADRHKYM